jgi:hypothetical protein
MIDTLLPQTDSPRHAPAPEPMPPIPPMSSLQLLQHVLNHPGLPPHMRLDAWRFLHQHWPQTLDDPICTICISDSPARVPAVLHPR